MQPGDTIQWTPGVDSLLDSLRAPVETLPPGPRPVSRAATTPPAPGSRCGSRTTRAVPWSTLSSPRCRRSLSERRRRGLGAALRHQQAARPAPTAGRSAPRCAAPAGAAPHAVQLPLHPLDGAFRTAPEIAEPPLNHLPGRGAPSTGGEQQRRPGADGERRAARGPAHRGTLIARSAGSRSKSIEVGPHIMASRRRRSLPGYRAQPRNRKLQRCPRAGPGTPSDGAPGGPEGQSTRRSGITSVR